jgi:Arc/MetJ family transcription regulator
MKKNKAMQITINLDDDLIKTAFELSGIKSIQELCEQALKVLIENYQADLIYSNEQTKDTMLDSYVNEDIND